DKPELIPDSTDNKVTVPADKVKNNTEVTATAKDPGGNESDPVSVMAKAQKGSVINSITFTDSLTDETDDKHDFTNTGDLKGSTPSIMTFPYGESDDRYTTNYVGNVQSSKTKFINLATGLTNDTTPTILISLDKELNNNQHIEITRYKVDVDNDNILYEVVDEIIPSEHVDIKGKNIIVKDQLEHTYSQYYKYEFVIKDNVDGKESVTSEKEFYFLLDTDVEAFDIHKIDKTKDNILFSGTGENNTQVMIKYKTERGEEKNIKVVVDDTGKYEINLNGWDIKDADGAEVKIVDSAGNVKSGNLYNIARLYVDMNTNKAITLDSAYNIIGSQKEGTDPAKALIMSDDNDWVYIGGGISPHIGDQSPGSDNNIDMAGGDDILSSVGAVLDGANINMGDGDDKLYTQDGFASSGTRNIIMGDGNDVISVDNSFGGKNTISLGEGNNLFIVGNYVNSIAENDITAGSGDDRIEIGTNLDGKNKIDLGDGDNTIQVGGYITNSHTITGNSGDDIIYVATNIDGSGSFNLGDGNNNFIVGGYIQGKNTIEMGSGDDTVSVSTRIADNVKIQLNAGDDSVYAGGLLNKAIVDLGDGDDVVTLSGISDNGKRNNMEELVSTNAMLTGGEGNDTLKINGSFKLLNMKNISGFETIDLGESSENHLDVGIKSDMLDISSSSGVKIFTIMGGAGNTVDLGKANITSHNSVEQGNYADSWYKGDTVDGYTTYTPVGDKSVELHIQQDILVI
ncbi:hypothetical protein H5Q81_25700, partial [Escherichia coli]|nr:hypothetical protein [Escherichia coli]MBZ8332886.1 hypothetical protein [Escherichia coli]